jgi:hypothetical protein
MKQLLLAAGVVALVVASGSTGQDPKPGDPKQPAQPKAGGFGKKAQTEPKAGGFGTSRPLSATLLLSYEENVELLDAQRETKKAHIAAAGVAVKLAEVNVAQIERAVAANAGGRTELEKARLEVEAAKARLEIQIGEMKEIEVRAKYAKKRLEEVKAMERAPAPENPFRKGKVDRKAVDPPPPVARTVEEVVSVLTVLEAERRAAVSNLAEESAAAERELVRTRRAAEAGAPAGVVEAAEAKAKEAKEKLKQVQAEEEKFLERLKLIRSKLKEIEK